MNYYAVVTLLYGGCKSRGSAGLPVRMYEYRVGTHAVWGLNVLLVFSSLTWEDHNKQLNDKKTRNLMWLDIRSILARKHFHCSLKKFLLKNWWNKAFLNWIELKLIRGDITVAKKIYGLFQDYSRHSFARPHLARYNNKGGRRIKGYKCYL